jgi:cytoskeletal protein CcmA (bactofilin family)
MSFFRREPRPTIERIESVIGLSASVSGHLKAEGGVRIDGNFDGKIESEGNVIIGESARIIADVLGFNVTIAGFVQGDVKAVNRLEILASGRVRGNVQAGTLTIEEGGVFEGQSLMDVDQKRTPSRPQRRLVRLPARSLPTTPEQPKKPVPADDSKTSDGRE